MTKILAILKMLLAGLNHLRKFLTWVVTLTKTNKDNIVVEKVYLIIDKYFNKTK
jgi:hypothetical protein